MLPPGYPWVPSKKFNPFSPAIGNIYMRKELYFILAEGPGVAREKINLEEKKI